MTAGKRSPDGLFREAFYNREIARKVVADLLDRNLEAELLIPKDDDIPLAERVKRINAHYLALGKKNVIVISIKELKLPTVKDSLDDIITDATAGQWDYRKFLRVLFEREVEQRIENKKYGRIRKAYFPQMKYLQELVREELPADCRNLLPEFEHLTSYARGVI